jgi:hypothetical protein
LLARSGSAGSPSLPGTRPLRMAASLCRAAREPRQPFAPNGAGFRRQAASCRWQRRPRLSSAAALWASHGLICCASSTRQHSPRFSRIREALALPYRDLGPDAGRFLVARPGIPPPCGPEAYEWAMGGPL